MEGFTSHKLFYASGWLYEVAKGILLAIAIVAVFTVLLATIFVVDGASMEPNLRDGQYILVEKFSYIKNSPQRGDMVVLKFPGDPQRKKYIKRVIGLPGESLEIKNSRVFINSRELKEFYIPIFAKTEPDLKINISKNEYFLIGDNRENSNDSRIWGTSPKRYIIGKAWLILLPKEDFSTLPTVEYY